MTSRVESTAGQRRMRALGEAHPPRAEAGIDAAAQYQLVIDSARDYAIITTDPDGRVLTWSPGAEATLGWTAAEFVGASIDETFTPEDRERGEPAKERVEARERGVAPDVRWHLRKDGARAFIEGTMRAMRGDDGELRGFLKIGQDVTQRRETEQALRESEARYRTLVENVHDHAIFMVDARGLVTEWTKGAERVTGYTASEIIGQHLSVFFTTEDIDAGEPDEELAEAAASGRAEREGWRVRKGGGRLWANEVATAVRAADGTLVGFTKILRDLTERRRVDAAAEQMRATAVRTALHRQLAEAEEDERRRLARALHDETAQHLTALGLGLQALSYVVPAGSEADRRAGHLREIAEILGRDVHALGVRLRPTALDDFGVEAAVASFVASWSSQTGIAVDVHADVDAPRLPGVVETAVYRVVEEALDMVEQQGRATRLGVVIERRDGFVNSIIEDDGRGFEPSMLARENGGDARRMTLLRIRERAALVGGTMDVESSPKGGTTLFIRIPARGPDGGADDASAGRDEWFASGAQQ